MMEWLDRFCWHFCEHLIHVVILAIAVASRAGRLSSWSQFRKDRRSIWLILAVVHVVLSRRMLFVGAHDRCRVVVGLVQAKAVGFAVGVIVVISWMVSRSVRPKILLALTRRQLAITQGLLALTRRQLAMTQGLLALTPRQLAMNEGLLALIWHVPVRAGTGWTVWAMRFHSHGTHRARRGRSQRRLRWV